MKRLLVTGGTGGLGTVVVPRLARDYECILMRRDETPAIDGPLFGIVALAGAFASGVSTETAAQMIEANLYSFTRVLDLALPHLEEGGRIVAISSAASLSQPASLAAYTASKSALNAYILSLAHELAPRRITANALLPTALATAPMRAQMSDDQLVPLARVAEWIAFLLSDNGGGVTGQLITLAGR
ncbi:MAG TPA: SDR family NAD(P)-dependent oxidoreductase [Thermoanaerobaculia bacterium]|jgi:3-oxoacyl-[acyl-carrier protein] reductase